ncbi:unnamed protein product [Aphanomyces euteiches]
MLITESTTDVPTATTPMRLHWFTPTLLADPANVNTKLSALLVFTEIYQVTGPVARFCRQIAAQGFLVASCESYHNFLSPGTVLAYDVPGTDLGNQLKKDKRLSSYDDDATLAISALLAHPNSNGRVGVTGMCLGGHLAFRAAMDPRVAAAVCYFGTDIHSETLGTKPREDGEVESLDRCGDIKGEVLMIFGTKDPHVPRQGRQRIYQSLADAGVDFTWMELKADHAFIRDELSKGRYDPAVAKICFDALVELFHRRLSLNMVDSNPKNPKPSGHGPVSEVVSQDLSVISLLLPADPMRRQQRQYRQTTPPKNGTRAQDRSKQPPKETEDYTALDHHSLGATGWERWFWLSGIGAELNVPIESL